MSLEDLNLNVSSNRSRFYYIHDPMCSWCWAHRPEWKMLEAKLADLVAVQYVVGGLAPDSDVAMPPEQQKTIAGYWQHIHELLGTEFNFDFWKNNTPRRSTFPACRAVIAAKWQNAERAMIDALQEAYYMRAMNPSDLSTHLELAAELGLDVEKFKLDATSDKLEAEFINEINFARAFPIQGFPSMILEHKNQIHVIALDYKDHRGAFAQVEEILAS